MPTFEDLTSPSELAAERGPEDGKEEGETRSAQHLGSVVVNHVDNQGSPTEEDSIESGVLRSNPTITARRRHTSLLLRWGLRLR
jgi:hypothetical protein